MNNTNDDEGWSVVNYKKTKPKKVNVQKRPYTREYNNDESDDNVLDEYIYNGEARVLTEADWTLTPEEREKIEQFNIPCECCSSDRISKILVRLYICEGCYCCEGDDVSYDMYKVTKYITEHGRIQIRFS